MLDLYGVIWIGMILPRAGVVHTLTAVLRGYKAVIVDSYSQRVTAGFSKVHTGFISSIHGTAEARPPSQHQTRLQTAASPEQRVLSPAGALSCAV